MADEATAWAQLLCITETKDPVLLTKTNIRIGRTTGKLPQVTTYLRHGQSRWVQSFQFVHKTSSALVNIK